jgi:hypothetical protein
LRLNDVVKRTQDNEEIVFGLDDRLVMIDFNDITCVLKGVDPIDNINIFLERTPLQNSNNTWISCSYEPHECVVVNVI